MRVLWTVNILPNALNNKMGTAQEIFGGWVEAMCAQLQKSSEVELAIACKTEAGKQFDAEVNGVRYFSLSYEGEAALEARCEQILGVWKPELVHIEGTEFLHAKLMLQVAKRLGIPSVVSLQGILNGQYQYQCGQLPMEDLMTSASFSGQCAAWTLLLRKRLWYQKRLRHEKETLILADHFLGRTTWDQAHAYAVNPQAGYHFCPRILRQPFYTHTWQPENIERHSLYVGNGYSASKGLHFMLMAMPQLIREYPDVKLYIAGHYPYKEHDKRPFFKKGYAGYLRKLVQKLGIGDHVIFTGPLSDEQVVQRLSKTHVYVLCSTIENSPNTLGEAMLVGTPCVAAYVGGVSDMAADGKEALFFRNDDPQLLAWNVKRIFDNADLALSLSQNAQKKARITHDPQKNATYLLNAYRRILEDSI